MKQELLPSLTRAVRAIVVTIVCTSQDVVVSVEADPAIVEVLATVEVVSRADVTVAILTKVQDNRILLIWLAHLPYRGDGSGVESTLTGGLLQECIGVVKVVVAIANIAVLATRNQLAVHENLSQLIDVFV